MKVKKMNQMVKKSMVVALAVMVIGQGMELYVSASETESAVAYENVKEIEQKEEKDTYGNEVDTVVNEVENNTDTENKSAAESNTDTKNSTDTETKKMYTAEFSYTISLAESTEYYGAVGELIERPADPSLESHTFLGWYTEQNSGTLWDFANDVMPEGGIILFAHFKANPQPIRFYAGEYADPASLPEDFVIDTSLGVNDFQTLDLGELPTPSVKEEYKDDYVFTGLWFASMEVGLETGYTGDFKIPVPSGGLYVTPVFAKISDLNTIELCASNIKFSVSEYLKYQKDGTLQDEILKKSEVKARGKENGGIGPVDLSGVEVVQNMPADGTPGIYDVTIRAKEGMQPVDSVVIKVELYKEESTSKNKDGAGNHNGKNTPKTGDLNGGTVQGLSIAFIGSCLVIVIGKVKKCRAAS